MSNIPVPNPVGTKPQREELRRRMHDGASFVISPTGQQITLDGLDIAEEMAEWIRLTYAAFSLGENEPLDKWDKWAGEVE